MTPDEAFQRAVQTASDLLLRWQLLNMRKMAGLTRLDVTERIGCEYDDVEAFETGIHHDPTQAFVRRYAMAVGARIEHRLLDAIPEPEENR